MAVDSVRQGTVSADLAQLAAALLAPQRKPIQTLEDRRNELNKRSGVLSTLKTKLIALKGMADTLGGLGTLSPFAAKATSSTDTDLLTASATANAAVATLGIKVEQLARRATHVSDRFDDIGTAIRGGGTGTFSFTLTIGGIAYPVSVNVGASDDDKTVLDNIATAIVAAVGSKGSAQRVQTETGKSRLSLASAESGTTNKITFTDTDGLLARIGLYKATPTAATDTTGGYLYEDLGGHELDAKLVVDGLTYYRASNTVSDLITGVTFTLKGKSATTEVSVKVQPDGENGLTKIKDFIAKYNDVLDYLAQNSNVDPKKGTRGVLASEPVFADLPSQLRLKIGARVASQAAGKPDSLAVLGIVTGADGKLSIKNETELRDKLTNDPTAITTLFSATDGIAVQLEAFVDNYSKASGQIALSQNAINFRVNGLKTQIDRGNERLAHKQALLEDQLARSQAILQKLATQANQIASISRF
jgi:flagellar hook-associated protein 2